MSRDLSALRRRARQKAATNAQEGRFCGSFARHAAPVPARRPSFSLQTMFNLCSLDIKLI